MYATHNIYVKRCFDVAHQKSLVSGLLPSLVGDLQPQVARFDCHQFFISEHSVIYGSVDTTPNVDP